MSFFSELKRRNVIRVGLAYVVAAWVLTQVMEIATDAFEAPPWVLKLVVTVLVVGLVPVLMFSWVYEITPQGIKREVEIERSDSITAHTAKKLNVVVIVLLAVAIGMFAVDRFRPSPGTLTVAEPPPEASVPAPDSRPAAAADVPAAVPVESGPPVVAVLPFMARTAGGDDGRFLADGIHDDLLTQLAKLDAFRVISRTSVMEYLGTTKNMRQIGEELGAGHILEGGVQQAGNRVRINAQLIDAASDEHLWAETFERELTPDAIFEVQAEIAVAIATALKATLSDEAAAALAEAPTSSQAAYEAFLQGRLNTYVFEDEKRIDALRQFENAVALDPEYAEAWGWLGFARVLAAWTGGITPEDDEMIAGALEAIRKARALEPGIAEADYAEAHYYYWVKADYPRALAIIEPLIESNPNNGDWVASRGWINRRAGNWEAAVGDLSRAVELDPRNGFVVFELAAFYQQLRRWDEARSMLERGLSITGNRDQYLAQRAWVDLLCCGDLSTAREFAQRMLDRGDPENMIELHLFEGNPERAVPLIEPHGPGISEPGPDGRWARAILVLHRAGERGRAETESRDYQEHLRTYLADHPDLPRPNGAMALASLVSGDLRSARQYWETTRRLLRPDAVVQGQWTARWADTFAVFGDADTAFPLMEEALKLPAGYTWQYVKLNSAYDDLRDDPRYAELEKRYGDGI